MLDVEKIKKDFPIFSRKINGKRLVYLDNGATTQKPKQVIDAISDYYSQHNANIHRGLHTLAEEATIAYENARESVAKFINAKPEEIIFTRNATEALNLVMYSYGLNKVKNQEKIVTSIMDHHSSFVPWQILAKKKNARFEIMNIDEQGLIPDSELEKLIGAKIAGTVHASNVLGTINDVKKMSSIVHENQGLFVLDGCQSVPHMPIDVKKLDADFFAFSGHKMLGPTGIGVLYGKGEILEDMEPFLYGGDMILEVSEQQSKWADLPAKFEAGTPNIAGAIGLEAAIRYLKAIGLENIIKHDQALVQYAIEKLESIKDIRILGPKNPKKRVGLISFTVDKINAHDIAQVLDSEGVAIRAGHHCVQQLHQKLNIIASSRASLFIYNSKEDIDVLCVGLEKAKKLFV